MTSGGFTESVVEEAALEWLRELGYEVVLGAEISPGGRAPERAEYREVVLRERLRAAVARINPGAAAEGLEEAVRQVLAVGAPGLLEANRDFHRLLTNGVPVEYLRDGEKRSDLIWLVDFETVGNNEFLAVNQFTVTGGKIERRPDIVLFVNGLPLATIELKNMGDAKATISTAYNQLRTYQQQIPQLFHYNAVLMISDGSDTRVGAIEAGEEHFLAWKTTDGETVSPAASLDVAIRGVFEPGRFLDLMRSFIVFEDDDGRLTKKLARYHQFHAVRKAVATALRATGPEGDGRGGVLWHTQGSGKSLTMLFFAGKLAQEAALANPTIVMLTDRTDLDDQLFGTFAKGAHVLRQEPVQAEDRQHLRKLLDTGQGGVIFTTIQKFLPTPEEEQHPLLSDRQNIIVMADEAHRTQYAFGTKVGETGKFVRGFAQHMRDALPNATFVAFTGTPLELADRDTRVVFGDYIDIYDVGRAIADGATVPIYYESRRVNLDLPDEQRDILDEEFDEITEAEEEGRKIRLGSRWSQLEAVVGTEKRLAEVAGNLVEHEELRQAALAGKIMIVCMSRRIAVDLYNQLVALRPEWHSDDDETGELKIIMTGSASDELAWQPHIRNKKRRERLAERCKDPNDPFRIAIVRDMWLTGFDAPSLHTIYVDKPMKGHGLMQAIARVNRVFRDKPGGLVVDYLGLANNLKEALRLYMREAKTDAAPIQNVDLTIDELVAAMLEKLELCREAFHGFNYEVFLSGTNTERTQIVTQAQDFLILRDYREPGNHVIDRFVDHALALAKAFVIVSATPQAQDIAKEFTFFQTMKGALTKTTGRGVAGSDEQLDHAIRQLVDAAIAPDGVVDIFAAAGLEKPDISILSDSFLAEVRDMPQKNLALELLKKLLNDEISAQRKTSVVQARRFSERLDESIKRYHNRALETAQIIEALITLARELRADQTRGEQLGLTTAEVAFYDALNEHVRAEDLLQDEQLREIAKDVAKTVRNNTTIDWTVRQTARAHLRRMVRRVLNVHGYPPEGRDAATDLVIEQAELLGAELAAA